MLKRKIPLEKGWKNKSSKILELLFPSCGVFCVLSDFPAFHYSAAKCAELNRSQQSRQALTVARRATGVGLQLTFSGPQVKADEGKRRLEPLLCVWVCRVLFVVRD